MSHHRGVPDCYKYIDYVLLTCPCLDLDVNFHRILRRATSTSRRATSTSNFDEQLQTQFSIHNFELPLLHETNPPSIKSTNTVPFSKMSYSHETPNDLASFLYPTVLPNAPNDAQWHIDTACSEFWPLPTGDAFNVYVATHRVPDLFYRDDAGKRSVWRRRRYHSCHTNVID